MKDFCVLGSGIAGSTIARLLSKNYSVEIFDKAKGVGGRTSNKRFKSKMSFDHGAQYLSANSNNFKKFLEELKDKNILKKWPGNHLDLTMKKKGSSFRYIGKKGNNVICKYLLNGLKVNLNTQIISIEYKKKNWEIKSSTGKILNYKNLIITFPFPQTKILARKYLGRKIKNLKIKMKPIITVLAAYKGIKSTNISSIKFNDKIITWVAHENSKKRFKTNLSLWTIQSSVEWSNKKIGIYRTSKKKYCKELLNHFYKLVGIEYKRNVFTHIHGWKYAYSLNKTPLKSFWSNKYKLGLCADWFNGPKVEDAWMSANDLYKNLSKKKPA